MTGSSGVRPASPPFTAEPPALLEVRGLEVSYSGSLRALRDVSLSVPRGAVVAVLGNNGAGKTTLLRAISGTLGLQGGSIDSGSIELDGRSLGGVDPAAIVRAGVVQVPEARRIFGELTVEENLRAGGLAAGDRSSRERSRSRIYELFPILLQRGSQRAGLLSGGEQQMLAIARALMSGPRLLLLDEPSLGLAPQMVEQIGEIVSEINRQGTSVVLVEQNAAMALELADSAFVLELGRVSLHGPAAQLAESDEVRSRYLAASFAERADPAPPARSSRGEAVASAGVGSAKRLSVESLTVRFGGISALSGVSFTVLPGAIHAVIGPNGAGKSTCLNVLSGVYAASEGVVRYGDQLLTRLRPHRIARLGVGRTFQNFALSSEATVVENLLVGRHRLSRAGFFSAGLRLRRARRERIRQLARVQEVASLVGLEGKLERRVNELAYGDRKRVELGRALCAEPTLLLLDEPVAGMTADESERMAETIVRVRDQLGMSIVLVEHDTALVMGIADRVTVLDFGRLIADGTAAEVQRDPEVVRAYLGSYGPAESSP